MCMYICIYIYIFVCSCPYMSLAIREYLQDNFNSLSVDINRSHSHFRCLKPVIFPL